LREPKVVWEVNLGAVVFARPSLGRRGQDSVVAYVGTHAGRFAGVTVEGEAAGSVVLDLTLSGMIWATAAADEDGRLYVGTDDDKLHAIDPAKSEIVWTLEVGDCKPTRAPGPEGARCDADGGPTIGPSGDLYLGADGVYRIGRDGKVKWHYPEGEDRPKHVFSSPLVTADGAVYFGGQDGFVTALTDDGKKAWQYTIRADVDGSAALGIDGTLYVGADDGRIHAIRRDGTLKWSFVTQKDIRSSIAVAEDGTIYATSFDKNLYSLDPDGNVRWILPTGGRIMSTPVLDRSGNVFFGSHDDRVYAVSPAGKVLWSKELPADVDSSVAITEAGTLVVGCDDGRLRALR
jgi:outer membrane protein assembly factor BamB